MMRQKLLKERGHIVVAYESVGAISAGGRSQLIPLEADRYIELVKREWNSITPMTLIISTGRTARRMPTHE